MIFGSDHRDKTEHPGAFSTFPEPIAHDYKPPQVWDAHGGIVNRQFKLKH